MSTRWQELACLGLRLTGIPWLLREVIARRKVTIINYHDPQPEVFARQMAFFAKIYSFIAIGQLAQTLEASNFSAQAVVGYVGRRSHRQCTVVRYDPQVPYPGRDLRGRKEPVGVQ